MISLIGMHVLGLIVKASYYLFLHPWVSLNTRHALLKRMFMIISGIVALSYSYVIIIACHGSNNVRIFVGIISTIVLSIVMLITGHGKCTLTIQFQWITIIDNPDNLNTFFFQFGDPIREAYIVVKGRKMFQNDCLLIFMYFCDMILYFFKYRNFENL